MKQDEKKMPTWLLLSNCNKLTLRHENFTCLPVKRNVSHQLCSTRHRWHTRVFLERSFRIQARDCSLCVVAHLINVSDVIEGCRKAPGEVISLSSLREASGCRDYSRGIHSTPRMKRDFDCAKDEEIRSDCALSPALRSSSSLLGIRRNAVMSKNTNKVIWGEIYRSLTKKDTFFCQKMDGKTVL